jgi:exosome complex exonuclease RRP6
LPNPYLAEIETYDNSIENLEFNLQVTPEKYKLAEETEFLYVETVEDLKTLKDHLNEERVLEIAIDLEAHTIRSYQGLTCLLQISTRFKDFIVDTLKLRSQIGDSLREIFDNPAKTKVLHGADMDIQWLQRDFGLYIVNMFDTGQAARILQLKSFGLAFLLQSYCGVLADKKYQLADWRIRPLTSEMMKYAREDTHYLLYVYDCMRKELIERGVKTNSTNAFGLLKQTLHRSNGICLKVWEKHIVKDFNYHMIL